MMVRVANATAACCSPFDLDLTLRYVIEGWPLSGPCHGMGTWRPVAVEYFETTKIPVLRGRTFTARDTLGPRVVIINQAMADMWWPDGDALGHQLSLGKGVGGAWDEPPRTIIGIVGNVRDAALNLPPRPTDYVPLAQLPDGVSEAHLSLAPLTWLVRTRIDPEQLRPVIENQLQRASGGMPITPVDRVERSTDRATARAAFRMSLMTIFGAIGLMVAAIGVYGVTAYAVEQRRREIGIRMAIGATGSAVERMVVCGSLHYAAVGMAVGVGCAVMLGRAELLSGVAPLDPLAFVFAASLLFTVAIFGAWMPAGRSARQDLMDALRAE
jgi:hypothetical protein